MSQTSLNKPIALPLVTIWKVKEANKIFLFVSMGELPNVSELPRKQYKFHNFYRNTYKIKKCLKLRQV